MAALGSDRARCAARPSLVLRPQSCLVAATRGLGRPGVRPCPCRRSVTRHRPRVIGSLRSPLTRPAPLPPRQPFVVRSSGKSISGGIRSRAYSGPLQTNLIRAQRGKKAQREHREHGQCHGLALPAPTPSPCLRDSRHRLCGTVVSSSHACRASVAPGGKAASLWLSRLLLSGEWGTGFTRFGPWRRGPKQVTQRRQRTAEAILFLAAGAAKN
jgi:hypothetical protein